MLSRFSSVLCTFLFVLVSSYAATSPAKPPLKATAEPTLSAQEMLAVQDLFQRLSEAFLAGDPQACMRLFAPGVSGYDRIAANLRSEFHQTVYRKFEVVQILPEDTLRPGVHSVDVRLQFELVARDKPPEYQPSIRNSTSEIFTIKKMDDGSFALLHSAFFENLGLRQGMGMVVEGLLALISLCALLAFWVWMGWEAWRTRPKQRLWRVLVLVPLLGALVYFVGGYLPRKLRG
ncbi:MAG TPA: hypothetical protein VGP72_25385 [Planctomycetota bacterium]|jgi:hypothetical protein